jgi:hypothetical protein
MNKFHSNYKGVCIERVAHSGMFVAFVSGHGYLKADTLSGIKSLIDSAIRECEG